MPRHHFHDHPPDDPRTKLLQSAAHFCLAFATNSPLPEILEHFSSKLSSSIIVIEHGLKRLAPFLGREFRGIEGAKEYFALISKHITYQDMAFENYVVDPLERKVSVRGEAWFTWTSTGQSWKEIFTYVLEFDDELKVVKYEIWADTGAAYLASQEKLVRSDFERGEDEVD
ncbi:hypothetical protein QBC37DRAFT_306925 [Rhypophila decipiens]|uniref:Uncharacterized protein n=1 Tax=Rhypophila decipiens TaxID=261697 RepID=A0AAN6YFX7_9PEZI|nr:hypothetical protein QBC37DRAFT_306925 [Rhypophila decipiens]